MKHYVVQAASALLAASLAGPALAGDAANLNPLGFSEDGRYFAFEEFGIQDGSGFPYANLTILDVTEDRWTAGSPFRIRLEEDGATLSDARDAARMEAEPHFKTLSINTHVLTVALHGDGEPAGDHSTMSFGKPGYGLDGPQDVATLTLTTTLPAYAGPCVADYGFDPPVGYRLSLDAPSGTSMLHEDKSVPASRGCTVAYRIYGIFAPLDWGWQGRTPVAVLSVYTNGFEGPDRRFIALPVTGYP